MSLADLGAAIRMVLDILTRARALRTTGANATANARAQLAVLAQGTGNPTLAHAAASLTAGVGALHEGDLLIASAMSDIVDYGRRLGFPHAPPAPPQPTTPASASETNDGTAPSRAPNPNARPHGEPTSTSPAPPAAIPQGLTAERFRTAAKTLRDGTAHIGGEPFVHGSRAAGTALPGSDIDFGLRVEADRFDELISERFGRPNPGSAKERTRQWAIQTGKIQAGEAGLSRLRRQLESELDMDVDLSIVRKGGPFDTRPQMEVPREQ